MFFLPFTLYSIKKINALLFTTSNFLFYLNNAKKSDTGKRMGLVVIMSHFSYDYIFVIYVLLNFNL